jgi:O-glycosyl hydrolase
VTNVQVWIDPSADRQVIDGFGVNINPVGHWRDAALIPTLDRLVDDLGATIFRLDPYGFTNWVDPDGTLGPSALNPARLAEIYRSEPFRDAWTVGRYLNERGAPFILNVSGIVPPWMCTTDGKTLADFASYADLLVSLASWARNEEGLQFDLFGPFNETDLGPPEGPFLDPAGLAKATALVAERFAAAGLGDLRFVVADQGRYNLDFVRLLADDPALRAVIGVVGMHCYSDISLSAVPEFLEDKGLSEWRYWLTEYGELDQTGEMEWEAAANSTRRLLRGLRDGARAALVWDAYDTFHGHDDAWTIWGIMRTARHMYTPKKRYFAAKQVYRFVPPGSRRIELSTEPDATSTEPTLAAFTVGGNGFTLVGLHEGSTPLTLNLAGLAQLSGQQGDVYVTDRAHDCDRIASFPLGERLRLTVPGPSVFTLTTVNDG